MKNRTALTSTVKKKSKKKDYVWRKLYHSASFQKEPDGILFAFFFFSRFQWATWLWLNMWPEQLWVQIPTLSRICTFDRESSAKGFEG